MAEQLQVTDEGNGEITLDNDPAPTEIVVGRTLWESMVLGQRSWATVTEDAAGTQHLSIEALNAAATFTWKATLPGRVTLLAVDSWTLI